MANFVYTRESVPVGESVQLEVQFGDSAGNPKDADSFPTIEITDAATSDVITSTSSNVTRKGIGRYSYMFIVPDGYTSGLWNDTWAGTVDGYSLTATFDFLVNSVGSITAVGTTVEPLPEIGDAPVYSFSREATNNINILLKMLDSKILNIKYDENGSLCPVFSKDDLVAYLCASLSEFNATPTITAYDFDNRLTSTVWADILTQGAYIIGLAAKAVHEAGREFSLNDNGVTVNPPPVSSTMTSIYNAQLSDYRSKLKEIKRNHRPGPYGMGAGSILVASPQYRRLRHLRERRII